MRIACHHKKGQHGFTLVEILIAMGIFMVIIGAIYASWAAILRSSKAGSKAAAEVQRNRMTLRCLEDSLASTVFFTENAAFYSFETDTTSDFAYLSFVSRLPSSFPGSGLFAGEPMRRVAFEVIQGAGGNNELVMLQSSTMQVLEENEEPYKVTLSTNISQFSLEFWDDQAQEWAYEWLETNSVPRMIRVSLAFGGQSGSLYGSQVPVEAKTIYLAGTAITKDFQFPDAAGGTRPPRPGQGNPGQGNPGQGNPGQGGQDRRNNGQGGDFRNGGGFNPGGGGGFAPGGGGGRGGNNGGGQSNPGQRPSGGRPR